MAHEEKPMLTGVCPILQVRNLQTTLDYYQKVLGFEVGWTHGTPPDRASVCRDDVEVNLVVPQDGAVRISELYFYTSDVDGLHQRILDQGGEIAIPIADRFYGMRDFRVVDPGGNQLSFGQAMDEKTSA